MFSNSKKNLENKKNSGSSSANISTHGGNGNGDSEGGLNPGNRGSERLDDEENGGTRIPSPGGDTNQDPTLNVDGRSSSPVEGLSLSYKTDGYDDLVEGLNSLKVGDDSSIFYSSLCENEEDIESEPEAPIENKWLSDEDDRDFSELSDDEYQEIIDYMINAVDDYSNLPEDKEKEIQENVGDVNNYFNATTPSEMDDVAEQIKNCWKSCEGLRIDQKASCMLKCACGEIHSKFFDPDKTPGLGPIFTLRFCAIPAVNTNFSVGGKRIYSIEEGLNEIYGVVDKLSREGKLGKWTQQYEFLDSSTKKINVANTFAFSIDIDFVDITNKGATHSEQYENKDLQNFNEKALQVYGISNPLNDPTAKNVYRIDWEGSEGGLKPLVDFIEDSNAYRYSMNGESIEEWMDQQGVLRTKISEGISDYIDYSKKLYGKKSES